MIWHVNIEDKKYERITVKFLPIEKRITFYGQHKDKNTYEWIDFSVVSSSIEDIDLDKIQKMLIEAYDEMTKTLSIYDNISEGFEHIKQIKIEYDSNDDILNNADSK